VDPVLVGLLVLIPTLTVLAIGLIGSSPDLTGDVARYHQLSGNLLRGELPYVDFELEYPVLSLLPMLIPRLFSPSAQPELAAYQFAFVAFNAVLTAIMALVIGRYVLGTSGRIHRILASFALLVALTAHLIAWRYDAFPAVLTGMGVVLLARGRPAAAGTKVGLCAAAKLNPVVLFTSAVFWHLGHRRHRDAVDFGAASVAAGLLPFLPHVLLAPEATAGFLDFQVVRGFQIESVPAALLELGSTVGLTPVGIEFAFGTYQLTTPLTPTLLSVQMGVAVAVQLALAAGLWLHLRRGAHRHESTSCLVAYSIAALLAFMITNKVLSPQHVIWLLRLVAVASGALIPGLVVVAAALGIAIFPALYPALIGLDPGAILLLNLRNLALVAALGATLAAHPPAYRRGPRGADVPETPAV
jgi:hypothetical protein